MDFPPPIRTDIIVIIEQIFPQFFLIYYGLEKIQFTGIDIKHGAMCKEPVHAQIYFLPDSCLFTDILHHFPRLRVIIPFPAMIQIGCTEKVIGSKRRNKYGYCYSQYG